MQTLKFFAVDKYSAKVYKREDLQKFPSCPFAVICEMATPKGKYRKTKVLSHIVYRSFEEAEKAATTWIAGIFRKQEQKENKKQAQKTLSASDFYKVGDILSTSWGYEQTNVDFYKVIRVLNKQIEVAELKQISEPGSEGFMCDSRLPSDEMTGKTYRLCVRDEGNLSRIGYSRYPSKWDGRPMSCSWYG